MEDEGGRGRIEAGRAGGMDVGRGEDGPALDSDRSSASAAVELFAGSSCHPSSQ